MNDIVDIALQELVHAELKTQIALLRAEIAAFEPSKAPMPVRAAQHHAGLLRGLVFSRNSRAYRTSPRRRSA